MTGSIRNTLARILLVSLYAWLVVRLVSFAMPEGLEYQSHVPMGVFAFFYFLFFNLNVEGSLFFDRHLNKKIPWFDFPKKRLIIQSAVIIGWALLTIGLPFSAWYIVNGKSFAYPPGPVLIFIASLGFLFGFIGVSMTRNFFGHWKISLMDAEHSKREKLKADYRVLQNQVNPHFLFNSLNVLISEIKHSPDSAVEFTRKLSKVYRYVLQSKNHELISLEKELKFIDSFIFLHQARNGNALEYSVDVSEEERQKLLPPLTLQILIENAIKHNVANEENILRISIKSKQEAGIVVSNNLQQKDHVESTYTGLSNLSKRFDLLGKDGFTYASQESYFVVSVPLIDE